jgi:prepilin-type N-terminal cleavage/methylation domain-containing protein
MAYLLERGTVVLEATVKTQIHQAFRPHGKKTDQGFSLIEVMISMALITIGLLSLLGVFGYAMAATQGSQENATAKLLADEAMEGILTARETANISWAQINNTGSGGIFLPGFLPIDCAGADGIIGTADDAACGPQILEQPGPTGVYVGTCPPDACNTLTSFTRQILISPVIPAGGGPASTTLRSVTITIQYTLPGFQVPKQYILNTFISPYL